MWSNTGSTETVVKYVVYRLPAIAAILFYWIAMKAVQQLTGLTQAGPMDRPIDRWAVEHDPDMMSFGIIVCICSGLAGLVPFELKAWYILFWE